jgi:tetratricopeptide (TPR) repeat protein
MGEDRMSSQVTPGRPASLSPGFPLTWNARGTGEDFDAALLATSRKERKRPMKIWKSLLVILLGAGLLVAASGMLLAQETRVSGRTRIMEQRRLADRLVEIGRTEDAKAIYLRLASSFTNDFEFNKRLAYCFFVSPKKEMAKAAEYYARAYALNPKDAEVELNLAKAYSWSQQYAKAIPVFRRIVERDPSTRDAWLELARAQNLAGQPQAARASYESYLKRWPEDRDVRMEFAAFLGWNKHLDAALQQYRSVLKSDPQNVKAQLGEAQMLAWLGKLPESLKAYDAVLRQTPNQYDALRGKAFVLLWAQRYDEAGRVFAEATKQVPADKEVKDALDQIARWKAEEPARRAQARIDALRQQADVAVGQKDLPRAISLLTQAIALAPQNAALRLRLGQTYEWNRQWDEAIATLRNLSSERPDNLDALRELANAQMGANKLADAAATYRTYLQRKPDDQGVRLNLARALSWSGKLDEAADVYQQILQAEPENWDALLGLGLVWGWQGQHEQALQTLDKVLRAQPDNRDALLAKAEILYWMGSTKEALAMLEKMQQQFPQDRDVDRIMNSVRQAERQRAAQPVLAAPPANLDDRIRESEAELARHPDDAQILRNLGSLYSQKGDYTQATSYYEKVLAQTPDDKALQLNLARVASWNRDFPRSIKLYQTLIAEEPGNHDFRLELAKILSWAGRNTESAERYKELLQRNPDDLEARLGLARVLSWDKQLDAALEEYARVLRVQPDNHDALIERARIYSWNGNLGSALDAYNDLLARDPSDREARFGKAQALFWSGHPRDAKEILDDLHAQNPKDRDVTFTVASVDSALGRKDLALQQLDELDKLQPGNPDVEQARQSIRRELRPRLVLGFTPSVDSYDLKIYYSTATLYFSPSPQIRSYVATRLIPSLDSRAGPSATGREFVFGSYGRVSEWLLLRGETGLNSGVSGTEGAIGEGGATFFVTDRTQLDFDVSRRFINYIPTPVRLDISRVQFRGAWDWRPERNSAFHLDYYHQRYSDTNRNNGGNFSATHKLIAREQGEIEVGYLYAVFGFTRNINSGFFAPSQFQRHAALLNFNAKLAPWAKFFFWGSGGKEQVFRDKFRWDGTARGSFDFQVTDRFKLSLGYGYFAISSIVRAGAYTTHTGYATLEYLF